MNSDNAVRSVLIVDDQAVPRSLEGFALDGTGRYAAAEAANGSDALLLLSDRHFDCAVIDLDMPDMSGVELIEAIRKRLEYSDMPVVLILPEGADPELRSLERYRSCRVLAKPFDPWDLAKLLDSLTGALADSNHILSVDAVLRGFPYPTMVLDAHHHVLVANGSFYSATDTGLGECYVYCNEQMHGDSKVPETCPLEESVRTGAPAERVIETLFGAMRVSVFPLAILGPDDRPVYLHVTTPTTEAPGDLITVEAADKAASGRPAETSRP